MAIDGKLKEFTRAVEKSLSDADFIKLSLGDYHGNEQDLKKILARKIMVKREEKLSLTYQYKTRDIVKNYSAGEAVMKISEFLQAGFRAGLLVTSFYQWQFKIDRNNASLKKTGVTNSAPVSLAHDHGKTRLVDKNRSYLQFLKITDEAGEVYKNAQDKYRQINRYIELLHPLLEKFPSGQKIKVADMGSGKGYLTFALYDYMKFKLGLEADVTGVEYRQDMVDLCSETAMKSDFAGLHFVRSSIEDFDCGGLDILVALHACDTATDDAIFKGIEAGADIIVVAPCCHKEVRREMEKAKKPDTLAPLLKHGIFMERQAEMATDAIRAEILEFKGYSCKVFEFISGEHTAKNVMITAVRNKQKMNGDEKKLRPLRETMDFFGIENQRLKNLLDL